MIGTLHPAYRFFIVQEAENQAIQIARHLVPEINQSGPLLRREDLPKNFDTLIQKALRDFNIPKVSIFDASGLIIFSSDNRELGTRNTNEYFQNVIAQGQITTRVVVKNSTTMDGLISSRNVVETYVPLLANNNFVGAFEIYYDISQQQHELWSILYRFLLTILPVVILMIGLMVFFFIRAEKLIRNHFKEKEKELAISETRYRELVENAKCIMIKRDSDGNITFFNEFTQEYFGYKEQEVLGRNMVETLMPEIESTGRNLRDHFFTIDRSGEDILSTVCECTLKNGDLVWVNWTNKVLLNSDGTPNGSLCIGTDITSHRLAEQALRESESRYSSMFEDNKSIMLLIDPESGDIRDANPAACSFYGYSNDKLTRLNLRELTVGSLGPQSDSIPEIINHGKHYSSLTHKMANGELRYVECFTSPISFHRETMLYSIIHDITDRRRMEQQLQKSKDEWERTFDSISDAITILDKNLKVIRANWATARLDNSEPRKIIGRSCHEIFYGKDTACQICPALETLNDHKVHSNELTNDHLDKIFLVTTSPILDNTGGLKGIVHVAKDITEQKHMEARIRQSQKMDAIGTLAGGVAHDFNNILAAILGFSGLIKAEVPPDSSVAANIDKVLTAGWRAKEMVKQILSFSRKTEHQRAIVQIHLIVKEALKFLRGSIPTTIEIKQDIDGNCGWTLADPTQIYQLIINLCTNGFHAMEDKGGTLTVAMHQIVISAKKTPPIKKMPPGPYIMLTVSDTGHGMDKKIQERIFDPYFTTKDKGKGTGLGLAIVQGIVQNHEGFIMLTSSPGQGSTFDIYLPAESSSEPPPQATTLINKYLQGHGRIMFVDDEEQLTEMSKKILSRYGYTITTFTSSKIALEAFRNAPTDFDMIITDMTMPELTGADLVRQILEIRPEIPCIMCTGYSESIDEQKAKEIGIKAFFLKPIDDIALAKTMKELLNG